MKRKFCLKNFILKTISWFMGIMGIFATCCIDTEGTNIFYIMFGISLAWFTLFGYANNWFNDYMEEGEDY